VVSSIRDELVGLPVKDHGLEVFHLPADVLARALAPFGDLSKIGVSFNAIKLKTQAGHELEFAARIILAMRITCSCLTASMGPQLISRRAMTAVTICGRSRSRPGRRCLQLARQYSFGPCIGRVGRFWRSGLARDMAHCLMTSSLIATRKPRLLWQKCGGSALRVAQRASCGVLLQPPPRTAKPRSGVRSPGLVVSSLGNLP